MASSAPNRSLAARAAAILTTSEVAAASFDLNNAFNSEVSVDLSFTIGSLTNVVIRFYASMDGVTYKAIAVNGGTLMSETLTASAERCYVVPPLAGWKQFRVTLQGTGTTTSSSATVTYRYLRRGSQS
jgi:hypothetical protein